MDPGTGSGPDETQILGPEPGSRPDEMQILRLKPEPDRVRFLPDGLY